MPQVPLSPNVSQYALPVASDSHRGAARASRRALAFRVPELPAPGRPTQVLDVGSSVDQSRSESSDSVNLERQIPNVRNLRPARRRGRVMQKFWRTCAMALIQIPMQIRAFSSTSPSYSPARSHQDFLANNFCVASLCFSSYVQIFRSASRRRLVHHGVWTASSFVHSQDCIPGMTRYHLQSAFMSTTKDAFTDQQDWLEIRRSIQALEPKYRCFWTKSIFLFVVRPYSVQVFHRLI